MNFLQIDGAVAQLEERVVRNDEVVGSIPISSISSAQIAIVITWWTVCLTGAGAGASGSDTDTKKMTTAWAAAFIRIAFVISIQTSIGCAGRVVHAEKGTSGVGSHL